MDQTRQYGGSGAVTAEFRGDVCVLRCAPARDGLAAGLKEGLDHCRESGLTHVVLDVDPCARLGSAEVGVLSDAADSFRREGGAVVMAVEDPGSRAVLTEAGLVRPPLPPPAEAGGVEPAVALPDAPHWEHEFRFRAEAEGLPVARRRVAAFAEVAGLEEGDLFEFNVAVAEALANALAYGSPHGADDEVRVRFFCYEHVVAVEIVDAGSGISATPICVPDSVAIGGRGIHLMRSLTDAVQFTCGAAGMHVLLVKRRR